MHPSTHTTKVSIIMEDGSSTGTMIWQSKPGSDIPISEAEEEILAMRGSKMYAESSLWMKVEEVSVDWYKVD